MAQQIEPLYAARLNSFKVGAERHWPGKNRITTAELLERAAQVEGLNAADLNYPDHFADTPASELAATMARLGLTLNGLAMRYYTNPAFRLGAFTNQRGIDTVAELGGRLRSLGLGQDGFD